MPLEDIKIVLTCETHTDSIPIPTGNLVELLRQAIRDFHRDNFDANELFWLQRVEIVGEDEPMWDFSRDMHPDGMQQTPPSEKGGS